MPDPGGVMRKGAMASGLREREPELCREGKSRRISSWKEGVVTLLGTL